MNSRLDFELLLRRHGWRLYATVALAAALCVAAAGVGWSRVAPPATVPATDGNRQIEDRYRVFRNVLIPRHELDARQRGVLDEATRHGLTLGRIDYGFEGNAAGRFGIATLQMPVRGAYADFRGFLAAVLASQPAIALDDLAIERRRDQGGQGGIEARLRLAFHTEPQPGSGEARP